MREISTERRLLADAHRGDRGERRCECGRVRAHGLRARERVIEEICEQAKDGNALTKVTAKRILSWLANSPDNDPPELGFADRR